MTNPIQQGLKPTFAANSLLQGVAMTNPIQQGLKQRAIAIIYRLWNFSTHPSEKFIVINNYFYRRIESC